MKLSAKLVCIAVVFTSITACFMPPSASVNQFDQGDYIHSAKGLMVLADEGNPQAQTYLGYLYQYGIGALQQDESKALQLFQQAAARGYAPAQNYEGVLYATASSIPHDYPRAVNLFQAAIAAGDQIAKANLAAMYVSGWGVPQDRAKAQALDGEIAGLRYAPMDRYALGIRGCVDDMKFYPREAVQQHLTGIATVAFTIDRRIATNVHIVKSSGSPALDAGLVQTVEACIFPSPPPGMISPAIFQVAENFNL